MDILKLGPNDEGIEATISEAQLHQILVDLLFLFL